MRVKYVGPALLAGAEAGVQVASAGLLTPKYPIKPPAAPYAPYAPVPGSAPKVADNDVILTSYKAPEQITTTSPRCRAHVRRARSIAAAPTPHAELLGQTASRRAPSPIRTMPGVSPLS